MSACRPPEHWLSGLRLKHACISLLIFCVKKPGLLRSSWKFTREGLAPFKSGPPLLCMESASRCNCCSNCFICRSVWPPPMPQLLQCLITKRIIKVCEWAICMSSLLVESSTHVASLHCNAYLPVVPAKRLRPADAKLEQLRIRPSTCARWLAGSSSGPSKVSSTHLAIH